MRRPTSAPAGTAGPDAGSPEGRLIRVLVRAPWEFQRGDGPVVAVALHNGHDLRPDVAELIALDDHIRLREEDPHTERFTRVASNRIVVHRSRFEIDLNRARELAICDHPDHCWDLDVWRGKPPPAVMEGSRELHDRFYGEVEDFLQQIEKAHGGVVVLDLHAYNHRRGGPDSPPDDPAKNPDVNLGTGSMDRDRWGELVDRFMDDLRDASGLDVRENVKFKGRELARFVHTTFPTTGCCLAIEFKKIFMDEHTGELDSDKLDRLVDTLEATIPGLSSALAEAA